MWVIILLLLLNIAILALLFLIFFKSKSHKEKYLAHQNSWEKYLDEKGYRKLAKIVTKIRKKILKKIDYPLYKIWLIQCQYNLIVNIMYAAYLREKIGHHKICFESRDCYFLKQIYDLMYPNNQTIYYYTSRDCYTKGSTDFIKYTRQFLEREYVWVDLGGRRHTSDTFFKKAFGIMPKSFLITYGPRPGDNEKYHPGLEYIFKFNEFGSTKLEQYNRAPHNAIKDVIYNQPEYQDKVKKESDALVDRYKDEDVLVYRFILSILRKENISNIRYNREILKTAIRGLACGERQNGSNASLTLNLKETLKDIKTLI